MRYHVPVHSLAERVLSHIRRQELLRAGDRVGVAVSGGIDSVALLRLLLELRGELGIVLSVVHFNHKLRGAESDADQEFVANLAREYELGISHRQRRCGAACGRGARQRGDGRARVARYGFFRRLLGEAGDPQGLKPHPGAGPDGTAEAVPFHEAPNGAAESRALSKPNSAVAFLDKIVTGHTLDDQAETVLMRIIRGAGLRGLGGDSSPDSRSKMTTEKFPARLSGRCSAIRRRELEQYLKDIGQPWREDSTNAD